MQISNNNFYTNPSNSLRLSELMGTGRYLGQPAPYLGQGLDGLNPLPYLNPFAAQPITAMQADTACEMTGGLAQPVEAAGDASGGVADLYGEAGKRLGTVAGDVGDAARAAGKAGRLLGPLGTVCDLVGGGMKISEAWNDPTLTDSQRDQKVGEAALGTAGSVGGGALGAWGGAAAGAAIGSAIPIVGTVIGGIVGAVLGGFFGGKAGEAAGEAVGSTSLGRAVGDGINDIAGK